LQSPGTQRDPDPALIGRAKNGDRAALRELLETVAPLVKRWALAHTGDPDAAADLCQDTLVQVLRKLGSFRGDSRFLTWLYSVTRNQALEEVRRRGRHERKMKRLRTETGRRSSDQPSGEASVDRERLGSLVQAFVTDLPRRQREVFQMADLQGMTSPEIGLVLGLSPGTVRVALLKARRSLRRKILEAHPEFVEEYLE
jgi:RNA polymerase sigma-70 factor (ECF subfamily)